MVVVDFPESQTVVEVVSYQFDLLMGDSLDFFLLIHHWLVITKFYHCFLLDFDMFIMFFSQGL